MVTEQWRPVANYEDSYEVSDQGRVRSLKRVVLRGRIEHRVVSGSCGLRRRPAPGICRWC